MKVKLLVSRAGPAGVQNCGDEVEVSAGEAQRMIAAQQAVPVAEREVERAVRKPAKEKRG